MQNFFKIKEKTDDKKPVVNFFGGGKTTTPSNLFSGTKKTETSSLFGNTTNPNKPQNNDNSPMNQIIKPKKLPGRSIIIQNFFSLLNSLISFK